MSGSLNRNGDKPSWTVRRRIIFATLAYCAVLSAYAVWQGAEMADAVLPPSFLLASAVIGSYVFGATWDDKK